MAGLDIALLTARSSLLMQQTRLAVTGNNVANANTVGYHRQTLATASAPAVTDRNLCIGTGVRIETVMRAYDKALERNLRQTTCQDGYYQTYARQVADVEHLLAPGGDSFLTRAVTDFATSLAAVEASPTSRAARLTVIDKGASLADAINRTQRGLAAERDQIANAAGKGELATTVGKANQLATEIAALNQHIVAAEQRMFNPQQANDLRDRREQLVGDLSRLADLTVTERTDGAWDLAIGGVNLVSGGGSNALRVIMGATGPVVAWQADGTPVSQDGGAIQALVDAHAYIRSTIAEVDSFAAALADTMNAQHAAGFGRLGAPGGDLFDASVPGNVSFLLDNPDDLAAAATVGLAADGTNIRALHAALAAPNPALGNDSLLTRPDRIVDSVAMDVASVRALAEGTEAGIAMFRSAIGAVSGVNVDEEMMAMLETQRAYQAAARFVGVIDDMLATVVQMVR